jgi:hypothetical protein
MVLRVTTVHTAAGTLTVPHSAGGALRVTTVHTAAGVLTVPHSAGGEWWYWGLPLLMQPSWIWRVYTMTSECLALFNNAIDYHYAIQDVPFKNQLCHIFNIAARRSVLGTSFIWQHGLSHRQNLSAKTEQWNFYKIIPRNNSVQQDAQSFCLWLLRMGIHIHPCQSVVHIREVNYFIRLACAHINDQHTK